MSIGYWDIVLIVVVSLQATIIAYLYQPKWKALMLALPVPFTLACLALHRSVDTTNVLGIVLLLVFTHGVRLMHYNRRFHILASIMFAALGYCVLGWIIARYVPVNGGGFWVCCASLFVIAIIHRKTFPHRDEPGHRTPLPVFIKLPLIVAVTTILILIKNDLRGFMTVFPMVGVFAAYESRRCLWTVSAQMPVVVCTLLSLMVICRLLQGSLGLGPALAVGWVALLLILARVVTARATAPTIGTNADSVVNSG